MDDALQQDIESVAEALPGVLKEPVFRWFERLRDRHPDVAPPDGSLTLLTRTVAASEFAGNALLRDWPWFVESYETFAEPPDASLLEAFVATFGADITDVDDAKARIRRFRNRYMLRLLWREMSGEASLDDTLFGLSDLADCILDAATQFSRSQLMERFGELRDESGELIPLVILGMGKLGGRELNFSSDIDLIFVYPDGGTSNGRKSVSAQEYFTRLIRHVVSLVDEVTTDGFAFRIDTRLRPFGDSGPPVVSFAALESYLLRHGREWERYAYVKARVVGPQPPQAVIDDLYQNLIEPFVYRRYVDYGVFESLREMHAMIAAEVVRRDLADNIKLGPGGIREIEFIAQSLQLVRGGADKELRTRELQPTLVKLAEGRGLHRQAAIELLHAYEFLRRLENFIQAIRDQQTHDVPSDPVDRARLCVAMHSWDWQALESALEQHRDHVSRQFDEIAIRGQDRDAADSPVTLVNDLWDRRASASEWQELFDNEGLADAAEMGERLHRFARVRAARQLDETARKRLLRFLPRMVAKLSENEQPLLALDRTLDVVESVLRRSAYLSLLNENRAALARLVELCGRSVYIAEQLERHPALLDELLDHRAFAGAVTKEFLQSALDDRMARQAGSDTEDEVAELARYQRAQMFHIAVADFNGSLPVMKVSDGLTWLAETVLDAALAIAWRDLTTKHGKPCYEVDGERRAAGFGIVGYGKLGGLELSYGSDLDIIFLHDSSGSRQETDGNKPLDNPVFFSRLVRRLLHLLTTQTGSGELYEIDTRLRPDGRSGVLVTSVEAFERYQEENAWTWEHQALLRARAVAGSKSVGEQFERVRRETLMGRVRREQLHEDVTSMRRRMRKELDRSNSERFDLKHGKGGIGDIEFLVQYLVLAHAHDSPAVIEYSDNIRQLDALAECGYLAPEQATALQDIYKTYRQAVHHLVLDEQPPLVAADRFAEQRDIVSGAWQAHLGV
ncbi:MAG: bifunctional [glutamate--ammonia ligase]-adenylyl-L-tyrosine phosphorylase/[glutamate--ammonia-ligase] adenylyltransferase [Woeseiaceae bacterium]|nr:bifunctional [glutamate--ammonia ligase]-adenylyl-L-tyrosine phosphorylase/[glutamate--ammonia-ligase] adenylyltransferase [Woeseiaceae bacterium]